MRKVCLHNSSHIEPECLDYFVDCGCDKRSGFQWTGEYDAIASHPQAARYSHDSVSSGPVTAVAVTVGVDLVGHFLGASNVAGHALAVVLDA